MHETGVEIDHVSRTPDLRRHYVGDGFSARVNNAIGPALKQFNILSHLDSSHPKFGLAMTCSEGTADEAIAMLDRSNSEAVKEKARIDATKERIYG